MFKSHDQSVKLEIFRIHKHGIVFRLTRTWSRYHIWRQGCGHPNNSYNNNGLSSKNSLCTCIKFSWQACAVATRLTLSNLVQVSLPNVASLDVLADANDTGNENEIKKITTARKRMDGQSRRHNRTGYSFQSRGKRSQ